MKHFYKKIHFPDQHVNVNLLFHRSNRRFCRENRLTKPVKISIIL